MTRDEFDKLVRDTADASDFHAACQMAYQRSKSDVDLKMTVAAFKKKRELQDKLERAAVKVPTVERYRQAPSKIAPLKYL